MTGDLAMRDKYKEQRGSGMDIATGTSTGIGISISTGFPIDRDMALQCTSTFGMQYKESINAATATMTVHKHQ